MTTDTPKLIAFRGPLGAGKTAAAKYLQEKYGFVIVSFAGPLKDTAAKITPDGKIDKKRDRALLQFLGTEYYRGIDENWWVSKWHGQVMAHQSNGFSVVTDDCRFQNELDKLKSLGGLDIWIDIPEEKRIAQVTARDGATNLGILGHASEVPLDVTPDFIINNHSDLEEFHTSIDTILTLVDAKDAFETYTVCPRPGDGAESHS